jgi:phenylacetate-CoA ligase
MFPAGFLRSFVLPAAERFTATRFWTYYKDALRFDRWDFARREALTSDRLAEVWNAALATDLQQQRLQEASLPATAVRPSTVRELLTRLPPVRKATFRTHFPAGVTNREQAVDCRYQSTAGTTDRMTVIANFRKRDYIRTTELRVLNVAFGEDVGVCTVEIPPNACNVVCGVIDAGPASFAGFLWHAVRRRKLFTQESLVELRGRFDRQIVHQLNTLAPIDPLPATQLVAVLDRYLEQIAALGPAHLRGFPVYLLWLADRCRDRHVALNGLKAVAPYGGLASPVMMSRIASGLRCRFIQKYGTSELGTIGGSCGRSPGMHLFEDLFVVELLRHGRPVAPGEIGRLAITDLINTAMPLIRYDVGDVGRLHTGPCPCGRKTARLEVLGRAQEVLAAPAGVLTASSVADTVFSDPQAANFRLEEVGPGSFDAAFVGRSSGSAPNLDQWRDRFANLHRGVRRVRARLAPYIQPESSGKYRFVFPTQNGSEIL